MLASEARLDFDGDSMEGREPTPTTSTRDVTGNAKTITGLLHR